MKKKPILSSMILAALFLVLLTFSLTLAKKDQFDYGPIAKFLPSNGTIFNWIKDLWEMGYSSDIGFRQPGSSADHQAAEYIEAKFKQFGLKDVSRELINGWTLWTPKKSELIIRSGGNEESLPCSYRPYTGFTGGGGVTAELVYVGMGTDPANFANAEGKIVVVDLVAPGLSSDLLLLFSPFAYDPDNTLPGGKTTQNWPVNNILNSYSNAMASGAIGYIGILNFLTDGMKDYYSPYDGIQYPLPGLYVSRDTGTYLKSILTGGPAEATLVLEGTESPGETYNVMGYLPGKSDEIILVTSHHDGWAANEGSGASIVMSLAKYFASLPENSRERTLLFLAAGGHFLGDLPTRTFIANNPDLIDKIVTSISIEMIGKEFVEVDGEFVATGLVAPRGLFISGPPFSVNPTLLSYAEDAVTKYHLDRTVVLPANGPLGPTPPGVAHWYFPEGVPIMHLIAAPAHQFTPQDTPNKVAVDQLRPVTAAFAEIIAKIDETDRGLLWP